MSDESENPHVSLQEEYDSLKQEWVDAMHDCFESARSNRNAEVRHKEAAAACDAERVRLQTWCAAEAAAALTRRERVALACLEGVVNTDAGPNTETVSEAFRWADIFLGMSEEKAKVTT